MDFHAGRFAQHDGSPDKFFVFADFQICTDRTLDALTLADQVGYPAHAETHWPVRVIHANCDFVRVADQGKWQIVLFLEFQVAFFVLWTDADNVESDGQNVAMNITNGAGLFRASRREIRRIEIENNGTFLKSLR